MAAIRLSRTVWTAFVLLNALLLALIVFLLQFRAERAELARLNDLGAALYPEPLPLTDFALTDQAGQPYGLERMRGAWHLVFFGFSNCPDMCPLTLSELGDFYRGRSDSTAPPLNVLFVSVDPADTRQIIGEYLRGFHPHFIGLRGTPADVNAFASQMFVHTGVANGAGHGAHPTPAGGPEGFISHSIHIGVVGPAGKLVGLLRPPHRAGDIAEALEMIFQRS